MKLRLDAYTLEVCKCGEHPRYMLVMDLVRQHRIGRERRHGG